MFIFRKRKKEDEGLPLPSVVSVVPPALFNRYMFIFDFSRIPLAKTGS